MIVDRCFAYTDIMIAISCMLLTVSGVAVAYIKSIELLYVMMLIQGSVETFINSGRSKMNAATFAVDIGTLCKPIYTSYQFSIYHPQILCPPRPARTSL